MNSQFSSSPLDGTEWGGFVVMNVDARMRNPYQILEDEEGETYYPSLARARDVCARLRRENSNNMIFVFALVGVNEALTLRLGSFIGNA